eukprot:gnl/MRDRNA2_/MRDRNA2_112157_c0_seq1.p1 gnl/MRDRNA2_/MRDRNA2_112157_c0~~gnl/MRDRNA2_/MRDRNA2_112157_c0_seq1.p1  ORF type:complete len:865 (+),score=145.37 gnl/MRDRNA2_/MRDRNA2_112157_c0_seq1:109-2703(+)
MPRMHRAIVIVGLASVMLAQAYGTDSLDEQVDKWVSKLVDRMPKTLSMMSFHNVQLDNSTLGKAAHRGGYQPVSQHIQKAQPRLKLPTYQRVFTFTSPYGYMGRRSMLSPQMQAAIASPTDIVTSSDIVFAAATVAAAGVTFWNFGGSSVANSASAVSQSNNGLLMQDGLPQFSKIKPKDVEPGIQKILDETMLEFRALESQLAQSSPQDKLEMYEHAYERVEKIMYPLSFAWGTVSHLNNVRNSNEWQTAYQNMMPKVVEAEQVMTQSRALYDIQRKIRTDTDIWESLSEERKRILANSITGMQQAGIELEPEQREELNKLELEGADLGQKFMQNMLESSMPFKLQVSNKEKIKGLPASARALAAQVTGFGATPEGGPWTLSLAGISYLPAMKHLEDRGLRERLYRAHIARASSGKWDNKKVISRILQIRKRVAQLFGRRSWAEYSVEQKMAPNVQAVTDLHEMLRDRAYPGAQKELDELQSFAQKEYGFEGPLQHWDIPFFSERLREKLFAFSAEELRSYFPLDAVLKGLFDLSTRLFDIKIVAADGEAEVWHPDVKFFKVYDGSSDQQIASFFLDAYSREDKLGGQWMSECIGRSQVMNTKPVAYMSLETAPPMAGTPALMTFDEVESLFHEFGHALQHMLTTVEDASAAGTHNIEWDAIELPSKFMENWCYDETTIMSFAKHYKTGEPLPKDLWKKVKGAKKFQASTSTLEYLFSSQLDIVLHDKFDPDDAASSLSAFEKEIAERYTVVKPLVEDQFLCRFNHVFAGSYDAGYYSYKWAEILSSDCFAAFEEAGLNNEAEVRRIGRRFRDTVLSMGGSKHPSDIFRAFRGRDPSPEPLLRSSGLDASHTEPSMASLPAYA